MNSHKNARTTFAGRKLLIERIGVMGLIPSALRSYTESGWAEASGATLAEVLADLDRLYPGIRFRMIDEQNRIRPRIRFFVADAQRRLTAGTSQSRGLGSLAHIAQSESRLGLTTRAPIHRGILNQQ